MPEGIYPRLRYALANIVRTATQPWRQHVIAPEEATSIFACSFGDAGWHHLRATLREVDAEPRIGVSETTLWRFLKAFQPTSISQMTSGVPAQDSPLPLFVYPWGSFSKKISAAGKDPRISRFCGPSSDQFVADEFARTIALYEQMKRDGYRPRIYPNSFIGGTWLVAEDGRRKFVVMQGNHRMAVLAHLGSREIPVRTMPGHLSSVRERDLPRWPLVASGLCSEEHARAIFRLFFEEDGRHVASKLSSCERL